MPVSRYWPCRYRPWPCCCCWYRWPLRCCYATGRRCCWLRCLVPCLVLLIAVVKLAGVVLLWWYCCYTTHEFVYLWTLLRLRYWPVAGRLPCQATGEHCWWTTPWVPVTHVCLFSARIALNSWTRLLLPMIMERICCSVGVTLLGGEFRPGEPALLRCRYDLIVWTLLRTANCWWYVDRFLKPGIRHWCSTTWPMGIIDRTKLVFC